MVDNFKLNEMQEVQITTAAKIRLHLWIEKLPSEYSMTAESKVRKSGYHRWTKSRHTFLTVSLAQSLCRSGRQGKQHH